MPICFMKWANWGFGNVLEYLTRICIYFLMVYLFISFETIEITVTFSICLMLDVFNMKTGHCPIFLRNCSSIWAINLNFNLKYRLKRNHLINQNALMRFIFCIPQNQSFTVQMRLSFPFNLTLFHDKQLLFVFCSNELNILNRKQCTIYLQWTSHSNELVTVSFSPFNAFW